MSAFSDRLADAVRAQGAPVRRHRPALGIAAAFDPPDLFGRRARGRGQGVRGLRGAGARSGWPLRRRGEAAVGLLRAGRAGWDAVRSRPSCSAASEMGFVTILDAKRGDIASTATAYADAAFAGCSIDGTPHPVWNADSLTMNPYLGRDAVEPFLAAAAGRAAASSFWCGRAIRARGSSRICRPADKPLYRHVAEEVVEVERADARRMRAWATWARWSAATHPRELAELRALMPDVWLLVPGYGRRAHCPGCAGGLSAQWPGGDRQQFAGDYLPV